MLQGTGEPKLTSFLVKVASRCNLDCDYCYVYHHADQSWRSMPRLLSRQHQSDFGSRLKEYAAAASLTRAVVIFHGGEPLLFGADALTRFANDLRQQAGSELDLDIGMQTNGLLLSAETVRALKEANISVSLSLDGPRAANDLHRNSRTGRSSFLRAYAGLQELKKAPEIFAGVICVIDPRVAPDSLLEFFSNEGVPRVDFLLPDAHHQRRPPGRDADADVYSRWLIRAFDTWLDQYPSLPVRTFEALLDSLAGLPSQTDAFGFGDVSLISIETDGTYQDLDVLKITREGGARLSGTVSDTAILEVARSETLQAHRRLLRKEGLCQKCAACDVVDVCGGGAVPHRFGVNGFRNPTVYCREMKALVAHARERVLRAMEGPATPVPAHRFDRTHAARFELAETSSNVVLTLAEAAAQSQCQELEDALSRLAAMGQDWSCTASSLLDAPHIADLANSPGAVAWSRATVAACEGKTLHAVDGSRLEIDPGYLEWLAQRGAAPPGPEVHSGDPWLRRPFGKAIAFEAPAEASKAVPVYLEACDIIKRWRPALAEELAMTCSAVQFVRDPSAHPHKIVSFSDNSVPGALYVSAYRSGALIDPYDLADSLIHEYRHQKLYLLERVGPMVGATGAKVASPWRDDPRPPSGLFHALFVFVELKRFWAHVLSSGPSYLRARATAQLQDTDRNLRQGFETLRGCQLTSTGASLADVLLDASASQ